MHRGLKHLFQVYEIDSNLEVMYDRLTMSWNSSSAFGRSECPDMAKKRLIFRSLARLWKAKQKKNASDQCKREPKCTREWKVTGQTSSVADAVPLACCKINFAMRTQSDRQFEIL